MTRSQNGFTLLELIVSIAMISIVVLILAGSLRLGYQSLDMGESKILELERYRSSLTIIDAQVQSHVPLSYKDPARGGESYYFQGERDSVQFATNYSLWGSERGFVLASYTVRSDDEGMQFLEVSENIIGIEQRQETRLFDTFEEIYFEYFYMDPFEEEGRWVERWEEDMDIPRKIKFHFIRGEHDFSLIVPLRVTRET